jgi:signal peptidase I
MGIGKQGTWPQALLGFILPLLIVGFFRWALYEPFVIPSGSMLPNLQIHDHVLVKKFSLGLKIPFMDNWLLRWGEAQSGQVIVFKYPMNQSVYYIKRLVGLPGDDLRFENGRLIVNGNTWPQVPIDPPLGSDPRFEYFRETSSSGLSYVVRYRAGELRSQELHVVKLGSDEYFALGDNRDESMDSRYWGVIKSHLLVAPAWKVLLGCEATLQSNAMLCDPTTLRRDRFWLDISKM